MLKLTPHHLDATDFVRLCELPATQALSLRNWLPESFLTKLAMSDSVADDCIEYEDYEFWFEYSSQDDMLDEQL